MLHRLAALRPVQSIVAWVPREKSRHVVREALPRRRHRVVVVRDRAEFEATFRTSLVDAALVDLGGATDEGWQIAELAREFPSVPFVAIVPGRAADAPAIARCVELDFADVLADGVDDAAAGELLDPLCFTTRFAAAMHEPPPSLVLTTDLQRATWRALVAHAGRPVRTETLARALGMTREHLSRTFSAHGAPNLKRVIDLVRLLAAAELAKNPGYDVGDVARVLEFASSSHLSTTAQRVVGTRPASLARLRSVDLIDRFAHGRTRSRS